MASRYSGVDPRAAVDPRIVAEDPRDPFVQGLTRTPPNSDYRQLPPPPLPPKPSPYAPPPVAAPGPSPYAPAPAPVAPIPMFQPAPAIAAPLAQRLATTGTTAGTPPKTSFSGGGNTNAF